MNGCKKQFVILLILYLQNRANAGQQVVKRLEVKRYVGKWYQIASIPTIFQPKRYTDTTATYTLNPNSTFHVLNESQDKGKRVSIEGLAYKADPNSDEAKFKLRFKLGFIPIIRDYWVLFLDDNYQYALVGHPINFFLRILSRSPQLDEKIYNDLVVKAANEGYDVRKLHKTSQSQAPPPRSLEAPKHDAEEIWY